MQQMIDKNVFYLARYCLTDQYYLLWKGEEKGAIFSSNIDEGVSSISFLDTLSFEACKMAPFLSDG